MPEIKGQIGYFGLTDWWLLEFTQAERDYIESVYCPMGPGEESPEKPLTQGEIIESSGSILQLLVGLSSWFRKPDDRPIAHRILAKAEELIARSDIIQVHFLFSSMGETYYKDRSDPESLAKAIATYEQQVAIAPKVAAAMKRQYPKSVRFVMPAHQGFKQLAIIREKEKDFQGAIGFCQTALKQGWDGDWSKRIERCKKKLQKQ